MSVQVTDIDTDTKMLFLEVSVLHIYNIVSYIENFNIPAFINNHFILLSDSL